MEKAEAVAQEIENDGGVSHAHQLDITDVEEVKSIVAHIIEDHGPIDIWMNIAGIYPGAPTLDMELDDFQKMQQSMSKNKRHFVGNLVVGIDGKKASQQCYLVVFERKDAAKVVATATYEDELVKTAEGWKFRKRKISVDPSFSK